MDLRVSGVELPSELEVKILELLANDLSSIMTVRRVCRRWKDIVDSNRVIWKTIPLQLPTRFPAQAEKWYRKAAEFGNQNAYVLLALLYSYGYSCACHSVPQMATGLSVPSAYRLLV
ncbi:hypothetical protein NDN08_002887 [Rhodosorus marinus]|uniref:F-box domain-containing protein n=1 Tax=Rhodosorus marinus TaxID=101924 RepID=A0AAV8UV44_9RHOD|nr:hypothetical protein NDN08_002887 [Rhodosorus marinus]